MKENIRRTLKSVVVMLIVTGMLFSPLTVLAESEQSGETDGSAVETGEQTSGGGSSDEQGSFSEPSGGESGEPEGAGTQGGGENTENSETSAGETDQGSDEINGDEGINGNEDGGEEPSAALSEVDQESGESEGSEQAESDGEESEQTADEYESEVGGEETGGGESVDEEADSAGEETESDGEEAVEIDEETGLYESIVGNTYNVVLTDPGEVKEGEENEFELTFTEIGAFNLTKITITVPDEFEINSVESPQTSSGQSWTAQVIGQVIELAADLVEPLGWFSDDRLTFSEWVSVKFMATPQAEGNYTIDTEAEWTYHNMEQVGSDYGIIGWNVVPYPPFLIPVYGNVPVYDWVRHDNPNSRHGADPQVQVLAAAEETGNGGGQPNGPVEPAGPFGFDIPFTPFQPGGTEETGTAGLAVAPEEPQVNPGDYLVIPPEDPESELVPLIDVPFVEEATREELEEAVAAYEVLYEYFEEYWEEMTEEEYARHLLDLSAAWAAIQLREAVLAMEAGEEYELETVVEATNLAMEHFGEHGEHLNSEQELAFTAVMDAVAELLQLMQEESAV